MNFYLDTEFREDGKTIDLISIGMINSYGKTYYAVSKEFDLKKAWNAYQMKKVEIPFDKKTTTTQETIEVKEYWLRKNVLHPIFNELVQMYCMEDGKSWDFTYSNFKKLIKKHGKTREQIRKELQWYVLENGDDKVNEFYGYYADYDWVVFCWLWGRMIDLPKGFPHYCKDLIQIFDNIIAGHSKRIHKLVAEGLYKDYADLSFKETLKRVEDVYKKDDDYPTQDNEHNALDDARWNKKFHEYLISING